MEFSCGCWLALELAGGEQGGLNPGILWQGRVGQVWQGWAGLPSLGSPLSQRDSCCRFALLPGVSCFAGHTQHGCNPCVPQSWGDFGRAIHSLSKSFRSGRRLEEAQAGLGCSCCCCRVQPASLGIPTCSCSQGCSRCCLRAFLGAETAPKNASGLVFLFFIFSSALVSSAELHIQCC